MTDKELSETLDQLRSLPAETEVVEFKEAKENLHFDRITFIEIYELAKPEGRVVMFQIPAAPKGLPVAYEGHYYGRDGEALSPFIAIEPRRNRADSKGNDKDYLIVGCPLLLAVDKIYAKIRNSKYRYIKDGTLFPDEIDQYEPFIQYEKQLTTASPISPSTKTSN